MRFALRGFQFQNCLQLKTLDGIHLLLDVFVIHLLYICLLHLFENKAQSVHIKIRETEGSSDSDTLAQWSPETKQACQDFCSVLRGIY